MSLRQLVEGDCGGVNPLMQLGGQFTRDAGRKDEGFAQTQFERNSRPDEQMVNEFLGQVAPPPQTFQMDTILQEMRDLNIANSPQLHAAPRVIDEVAGEWSKDFSLQQPTEQPIQMLHMQPQQQQMTHVREFFDDAPCETQNYMQPMVTPYRAICPPFLPQQLAAASIDQFFDNSTSNNNVAVENDLPQALQVDSVADWINDYQTSKEEMEQTASNYNEKFWQRLQEEWQKLSEETEHPWLTEFSEGYDPYKEYQFAEENPMSELKNAFQKGKEYIAKGDIPSAVLCFEAAVKKEPENAEIWELLGMSQAENEMDPQSIAALKRSLELQTDNRRVLMALAVCYTNESLQSHAVKMLTNWLQVHPKYRHLIEQHPELQPDAGMLTSSLIRGNKLQELQHIYLQTVRMNPTEVDADVQEALGVLYNLSGEFDKAVDCFRVALHANPQNAKVWNRLGASLANGSRSVEAVEAYQQALQLEPGFIRVRYNVGVCCMNLKAYKQAVEHLLTALNMQANSSALRELPTGTVGTGQQQMSESIWNTLKMILSLMGRNDLQGFVTDRYLPALNEAFKE